LVLVLWAVIEVAYAWGGITPILNGDFPDSDGYARLLRVFHLVDTGDWYNSDLPRSNWPFGETMNWTRPLDIALLAGAVLLWPFVNFHDALFWFGIAISPLCALACAFAAAWMVRPFFNLESRTEVALLLLLQPGVASYTDAGRPDHHGLLFLTFIVASGYIIRALATPTNRRAAVGAGIVIAVGLWISTEFLAMLIVGLTTFGLLWLYEGDRWRGVNQGFVYGFTIGVAFALPIERSPFAGLFVEEHDRLSIVHLALAILLSAFWTLVPRVATYCKPTMISRGMAAGAALILVGLVMFATYPNFFAGPLGAVDKDLFPIWFSHIAEWQPVLPNSITGLGRFLFWIGPPVIAVPWAIRTLWLTRHHESGPIWLFVTLTLVFFIALTMRGLRFSPYAEVSSLAPLVLGIKWIRERIGERGVATIVRAVLTFAVILGLPFAGAFILMAKDPTANTAPCRLAEIAPMLRDPAGLGAHQLVIAAAIDSGPEIMYRTPHAVLATPMHRNAAGILATYHLFTATDNASAKAIVDSRGVDLNLLCPDSGERQFFASGQGENTFYNKLMSDKLPLWIKSLPLADPLSKKFRLFIVLRHLG
jgi:hypothetical protein